MTPVLPILRLRLELDRALRDRAYFSRAIAGRLRAAEYAALIAQYGALLAALTGAPGGAGEAGPGAVADEDELGAADLEALARDLLALGVVPPRPVEVVLAGAAGWRGLLPRRHARDVACAVLGTSWIGDALESLSRALPTGFLEALARAGARGLEGARRAVGEPGLRPRVHAFAELTRGAVLGLATHLDITWPAPTYVGTVPATWEDPVTPLVLHDPLDPATTMSPFGRAGEVRS